MTDKSVWLVEVDGVPVSMRKAPPEPKPLVGACVVQDVLYVPKSDLDAMSRAFARACEDAKAGPLAIQLSQAQAEIAALRRVCRGRGPDAREERVWDAAFAASFIARTVQQRPLVECEGLAVAEAGDCLRAFRKALAPPPPSPGEKGGAG